MNFKCFLSETIGLKPLTLLTGLNGMGKSSALQGLLLLRQSYQQRMLPEHGLLLNGPLVSLGTSQFVLCRQASEDLISMSIQESGASFDWTFVYESERDVLRVSKSPNILPAFLLSPALPYLGAERLGPRSLYDYSSHSVRSDQAIEGDARHTVAFLDTWSKVSVLGPLHHANALDRTLESEVNAWLGEITPGAEVDIRRYPELARLTLGFRFAAEGAERTDTFSAPNTGFGLAYILPVLVAVLTAREGSPVLIENPEAHVHPKGQVALGRMFSLAAASGVQILVETHSDHILNGVRVAVARGQLDPAKIDIHFFSRRIQNSQFVHFVESPRVDKSGRLSFWPENFFDQWESALDALMES